jgi:uncharacterized membrane protein
LNSRTGAGLAALLVGLIVLGTGIALYASTPAQTNTSLLTTSQYLVKSGDEVSLGIPLSAGQTVAGTFQQSGSPTVNFYFMNSTQQNYFANCAPCQAPSIVNESGQSSYQHSWDIGSTGTYYFILDNSWGSKGVSVTLTANLVNSNSTTVSAAEILLAVGVVLVIIGAVVATTGRRQRSGPAASMAKPSSQSS